MAKVNYHILLTLPSGKIIDRRTDGTFDIPEGEFNGMSELEINMYTIKNTSVSFIISQISGATDDISVEIDGNGKVDVGTII
jgi:predicted NUDIX family NTP pyrophosphohydrolase